MTPIIEEGKLDFIFFSEFSKEVVWILEAEPSTIFTWGKAQY